MKKLIALLVIASSFTAAQAAPWSYIGTSIDTAKIYLRFPSVQSYNNGRVETIWKKIVNTNGTYSISRVEFHCPSQMLRTIQYSRYYIDGTTIPDTGYNYDLTVPWSIAVPESVGEYMVQRVCI